ncbi:amino acid ABC transporter permease [Pectinatus cerevisiiphilus]|uniref:Amino acid ABC transporter membrane protein (PAAT family) n=1 Tax=Pectinatus cerevisiiphilus TaxID=86956 RepID=A0A4R3KFS4_9FIRM|nr:amino acid ABC transporter permease [Pectinatus cerevisiiphilus]TCS81995.1 amino acid ABC transporter membrane protein (PAAT family) [Pectinatus cerevisiiphilus]
MAADMPTTFFGWVVFIINQYGSALLQGAGVTLMLAIVGTLIGCIIGLLVGIVQTVPVTERTNTGLKILNKIVQFIFAAYVEIFRGTPMIVQAMVVYYGSMAVFDIDMSAMLAGFLVVSVNTGAYMAETVRGGIISIDKGQTEAAMAIGMNHFQTMYTVVLPQALKNIMPQIGNNLIINIKDTSVLNVISVTELYFASKSAAGVYYRYFEVFFVTCVIYFIMTFAASRLLRYFEKRMAGSADYQLVGDPMADPTGIFPNNTKMGGK